MDYYKVLAEYAKPVELQPGESSYASSVEKTLDPKLFIGIKLIPSVRNSILGIVIRFLDTYYQNADKWATVWLAGSGISYHWSAHRNPADLDCLISVDNNLFRMSNAQFVGFSNQEIANQINELLKDKLHPLTNNYMGVFDLTFFVNKEENPLNMKPYAAYSLTDDRWIVEPTNEPAVQKPEWDKVAAQDESLANNILAKYSDHLYNLLNAQGDAGRRNAETLLVHAIEQGAALFDTIHEARSQAFSTAGEGYSDFNNYRWQAGKKSGVVPAMKILKDLSKESKRMVNEETYGVELPNASTLIRRAILNRKGNE